MGGHMILSRHYHLSLTPLERLDPYGGTYNIVQTLSNVPSHLGRLGPYGGTYDIDRKLSNILWSVNIICPGHYQMSLGNAKCPTVIINCTHF